MKQPIDPYYLLWIVFWIAACVAVSVVAICVAVTEILTCGGCP